MLNNNKKLMCFILYGIFNSAQAEVLVILPESGPMARAGLSIKQGFMRAYQASGMKTPIKFVNSDQKFMAQLLKRPVTKTMQLIAGPLVHNDVDALMQVKPKLGILRLSKVTNQMENVWQFSLSKKQDVLNQVLEQDKIKQFYLQASYLKHIEFQGRTGLIQISGHQIYCMPHCYENTEKGLKVL
ncbi:hypothetical protein B9T25_00970 [Acinetobacter sp. ANC 4470]|uniref:penicillin-binding protein activator n=1 Tax=Acinetobacter sp. ANC 4470 TaxID=1977881 RepID=UPI000A34C2E1|nr:penicillin-binding protein activator [Acinetobacter sp. ANC 4470]OTG69199.1 hypothetical protein B9T25_00970 [Acinetobacter sp. ANC 4470]